MICFNDIIEVRLHNRWLTYLLIPCLELRYIPLQNLGTIFHRANVEESVNIWDYTFYAVSYYVLYNCGTYLFIYVLTHWRLQGKNTLREKLISHRPRKPSMVRDHKVFYYLIVITVCAGCNVWRSYAPKMRDCRV